MVQGKCTAPVPSAQDKTTMKCVDCKFYLANYCKKYDEVTKPDSEVRCVGFEATVQNDCYYNATCGECCFFTQCNDDMSVDGWCDFHNATVKPDGCNCEAWEPRVEL